MLKVLAFVQMLLALRCALIWQVLPITSFEPPNIDLGSLVPQAKEARAAPLGPGDGQGDLTQAVSVGDAITSPRDRSVVIRCAISKRSISWSKMRLRAA